VKSKQLAGETIQAILTKAPGNDAAIGGMKVIAEKGWFAARPSGTEDIYKIYAESFRDAKHLQQLIDEAQKIVSAALAGRSAWASKRAGRGASTRGSPPESRSLAEVRRRLFLARGHIRESCQKIQAEAEVISPTQMNVAWNANSSRRGHSRRRKWPAVRRRPLPRDSGQHLHHGEQAVAAGGLGRRGPSGSPCSWP
jgi:hypothetical protein